MELGKDIFVSCEKWERSTKLIVLFIHMHAKKTSDHLSGLPETGANDEGGGGGG